MQKTACNFPEWINESVVDEAAFAQAYAAIADDRRALLKTCIARLFEWYGPSRQAESLSTVDWRGGFTSKVSASPADFAIVVFDHTLASPARLLAGVLPALSCGVTNVLAVRLGGGAWHQSLLVGLELAGQELVVDMAPDRLLKVLHEMDGAGHTGIVLGVNLDQNVFRSLRFSSWNIVFSTLECHQDVVVWMDSDAPFDCDALAFAQPDCSFTAFGRRGEFPIEFSYENDDFQHFLASIRDIAYVPASRAEEALSHARLVLGPGHEGCWFWPQLRPELFQFYSTAWTTGA